MLTIDFEKKGSLGLCEFIVCSIKEQIANGVIKENEKLPSKRALALHLGVSIITVQNAYNILIAEGFIYSIEKKGFFVSAILKKQENPLWKTQTHESSSEKYFADFRSNSTLLEKFPFSIWAKISRQVLCSGNEKLLERQSLRGVLDLRQAIAKYLFEFRNMKIAPEQIIIGAGTESLYSMLIQFLGREKKYAVENPGYKKIASLLQIEGAHYEPIPLDPSGINIEKLKKSSASVLHLSPSHHFPTGIVTSIELRNELLEWALEKEDRYIIEDDYDSEFRFNGKTLPTLQSKDKSGKVIYLNTFSKTLAPSFRMSYMILPGNLLNEFNEKFSFASCQVSAFEQFTLAEFIAQGCYSKHIIRMKNFYRNLRNALIQALLSSKLKNHITLYEQESGLHFLLAIKSKIPTHILNERLQKESIQIPRLNDYFIDETFVGDYPENTFVVNYSGIKKESIAEIVQRLERVFL